MYKEYEGLNDKGVLAWRTVKDWEQCAEDARRAKQGIHMGQLFGFCVLKNAEAQDEKDQRRKSLVRIVEGSSDVAAAVRLFTGVAGYAS